MKLLRNLSRKQLMAIMVALSIALLAAMWIGCQAIIHGSLLAVVLMPVTCGILLRCIEILDHNQSAAQYGQIA